jgi:hypothetical protein
MQACGGEGRTAPIAGIDERPAVEHDRQSRNFPIEALSPLPPHHFPDAERELVLGELGDSPHADR